MMTISTHSTLNTITMTTTMTTMTMTMIKLLFITSLFAAVGSRSLDRRQMLEDEPDSIILHHSSIRQLRQHKQQQQQQEIYQLGKPEYNQINDDEDDDNDDDDNDDDINEFVLRPQGASTSAVSSIDLKLLCSNGGSSKECMDRTIPKQTLINLLFQIKTQMSDQPARNIPDKRRHDSSSGFYSNW